MERETTEMKQKYNEVKICCIYSIVSPQPQECSDYVIEQKKHAEDVVIAGFATRLHFGYHFY